MSPPVRGVVTKQVNFIWSSIFVVYNGLLDDKIVKNIFQIDKEVVVVVVVVNIDFYLFDSAIPVPIMFYIIFFKSKYKK